jgi:hypothetical protein
MWPTLCYDPPLYPSGWFFDTISTNHYIIVSKIKCSGWHNDKIIDLGVRNLFPELYLLLYDRVVF